MIAELLDRLAAHDPGQVLLAGSYAAVPAFAVADVAVARRAGRAPVADGGQVRAAATLAAGAVAIGLAYGAAFAALFGAVAARAPAGPWADEPVVAALVAFVAWDALGWLYHLVGHATALGWAGHRAHHTGRTFDGSLALRQSWFPWYGLAIFPWVALTGASPGTVAAVAAASNLLQAVQHSATGWRPPRLLAAVVMTPESHRHHHAAGAGPVNLGPVLTVWDRLAGTWRAGPVPRETAYGEPGRGADSARAAVSEGWRALRRPPVPRPTPGRALGAQPAGFPMGREPERVSGPTRARSRSCRTSARQGRPRR